MLDTTARYIYTVYRLKSVSLAAEELFISQPALSRAIKKAEAALGAPIFNRKTLPFSLTAEGKLYIEAIEKMLRIEQEAAEKISDIRHNQGGTLRIATATQLSFFVIPRILKAFQQRYPQVDIHIIVTDGDKLYEQLQKETADLTFVSGGEVPEGYGAAELFEERFVVAMPREMIPPHLLPFGIVHEALVAREYEESKIITDMSFFHGIEFIYSPPHTNIQKKRKLLFGKSDITPYVTSNAPRIQLNYNLMRSGFGALLTSDADLAVLPPDEECRYFVLGGPAAKQGFSIVYPQEAAGLPVKEFVQTARELFSGESPLEGLYSSMHFSIDIA